MPPVAVPATRAYRMPLPSQEPARNASPANALVSTGVVGQHVTNQGDIAPDYHRPDHLPSPIVQQEEGIHLAKTDKPLQLNALERAKLNATQAFVTLPKTMVKGLKGDPSFNFSDFMLASKFPYYVGGATLAALYTLGGGSLQPAINMAVGVLMYMGGQVAANTTVNALQKAKTGLDLTQVYQSRQGNVNPMWASIQFPRTDLLTDQDYEHLARKMGVPEDASDPKLVVNQKIHRIISDSRLLKLVLGTTLSAVGAGYFARTPAWGQLSDIPSRFMAPGQGNLFNRIGTLMEGTVSKSTDALRQAVKVPPFKAALQKSLPHYLAWAGVVAAAGYTAFHILKPEPTPSSTLGSDSSTQATIPPATDAASPARTAVSDSSPNASQAEFAIQSSPFMPPPLNAKPFTQPLLASNQVATPVNSMATPVGVAQVANTPQPPSVISLDELNAVLEGLANA